MLRIGLLVITALVLVSPQTLAVDSQKPKVSVTVELQAAPESGVDFKRLEALVYFFKGDDAVRVRRFVPNKNGGFRYKAPAGERGYLAVNSYDPTIIRHRIDGKQFGFYSWRKNGRITIISHEYRIGADERGSKTFSFRIERGARIKLVPRATESFGGQIYMKRLERKDKDSMDVLFFDNSATLSDMSLGGLLPGTWEIRIFDSNDQLVFAGTKKLGVGDSAEIEFGGTLVAAD